MSVLTDIKNSFDQGTIAVKLIFIITISSVLVWLLGQFLPFNFMTFIGVPGNYLNTLYRPWTLITYAFAHGGLWHLAGNMIGLYFLGQLFFTFFRESDFLKFFLLGSIAGGLLFLISIPLLAAIPNFNYNPLVLVGASAGLYSVLFALTAYSPKMPLQLLILRINFRLDYLAYIFLGISILGIILQRNIGGNIAHLGGAAFGYFYMKSFEKGKDFLGGWIDWLYAEGFKIPKKNQSKPRFRTQRNYKPPKNDYDYATQKKQNQEKVDAILDKISASGYDSLTKKEKEFLFKQK